jgi:hypothetical protein
MAAASAFHEIGGRRGCGRVVLYFASNSLVRAPPDTIRRGWEGTIVVRGFVINTARVEHV